MRRILVMLLSVMVFSVMAAGLNENVPVQSFEEAGTTPAASTQPSESNPPVKTVAPSNAASTNADSADNMDLRALQAELTQINQNSIQYQQKTDEQILMLSNQVNTLSAQVDRIQKAMMLLDQEVNAQQSKSVTTDSLSNAPTAMQPSKHWMDFWEGRFGMWSLILLILVILGVLAFIARLVIQSNKKKTQSKNGSDTDDEYDYLGSEEGMLAKLNLARAYIKMEDYKAAHEVLDEVLNKGSEQQKADARELKKKCQ